MKEVVVLSRHNIRTPLSSNDSVLCKITPHEWIEWSSNPGELTSHGGILETMMGQYYRKCLINEGMFTENYIPNTDEVNIYANSMQRTIAIAQYFSSGFIPIANLRVYHRYSASKMDPIFHPRLTKVSKEFEDEALKQIETMGLKDGIYGISKNLDSNYKFLSKVLNMKESNACK